MILDPIINCLTGPLTYLVKVCACRLTNERLKKIKGQRNPRKASEESSSDSSSPPLCVCDYTPCQRRERSFGRVEEKLQEELEVVGLIKKIREMHGMLQHTALSHQKQFAKYNKHAVINIESEESGDDETGEASGSSEESVEAQRKHSR